MIGQVLAHRPAELVVSDPARVVAVREAVEAACSAAGLPAPRISAGAEAVVELAGSLGAQDVVLNAITGSVGLLPTLLVTSDGAASIARDTITPVATTVRSPPRRRTAVTPSGVRSAPSVTGPEVR